MTTPDPAPKPPYPVDADPCSAYCLCWVPPTCREVPHLVCCKPEVCCKEKVFRNRVDFEEVCTPGCYEKKTCPCKTRTMEFVQTTPGHREWQRVDCCGPCPECYCPVDCPPTYKCCEKTVTEKGVEYCAFKPPQYDVVAKCRKECVEMPVHVPAQYKVVWENEPFQPGHWEWRKNPNCVCPSCQPAPCAPPPPPPCACPPIRRGDFSYAPAKD